MKENEDFKNIAYHDLEEIQNEFLKYAPAYAQSEAKDAIGKIIELQSQGLLRNGIYYITLVDLVGSTKYAAEHGNDKINQRIKTFVKFSFDALTASNLTNAAIFLKEIGDAVLLIFQHFPDVLKWRSNLQDYLDIFDKPEPYQIRTCIHIGEVSLDGINPISIAVSQTFKIEKSINAGEIGLTDIAYHVAWPTIARAYHGFSSNRSIQLDGFRDPVKLHLLDLNDKEDLKRIVHENEESKDQ